MVPVLFTFYIQGVPKLKKIIPAPKCNCHVNPTLCLSVLPLVCATWRFAVSISSHCSGWLPSAPVKTFHWVITVSSSVIPPPPSRPNLHTLTHHPSFLHHKILPIATSSPFISSLFPFYSALSSVSANGCKNGTPTDSG